MAAPTSTAGAGDAHSLEALRLKYEKEQDDRKREPAAEPITRRSVERVRPESAPSGPLAVSPRIQAMSDTLGQSMSLDALLGTPAR